MTISWYGEACFLLESGGVRVLIEPPQKESGINSPRLKSDILIYSKPRNSEGSSLNGSETETFIIDSPGEYEIKGINVLGIADDHSTGSLPGPEGPSGPRTAGQANTIYNIEIDGIKISHLGFLGKDLDDGKMALINDPDIVLVPVGNGAVLDAEKAMKLINKIEPSVAIPMLYDISAKGGSASGGKGPKIKRAPLSVFLKESEAKESSQPKLTIKKKDLIEEETKIVILEKV
ncbi:MAG: MBL fold metallo-hydrolase [Candidatus Azambacteria bacterium]|nr:MBL fold metallo-hydrolase [Candidatus Azambacteria bacterium]